MNEVDLNGNSNNEISYHLNRHSFFLINWKNSAKKMPKIMLNAFYSHKKPALQFDHSSNKILHRSKIN